MSKKCSVGTAILIGIGAAAVAGAAIALYKAHQEWAEEEDDCCHGVKHRVSPLGASRDLYYKLRYGDCGFDESEFEFGDEELVLDEEEIVEEPEASENEE